jgi:nucleotide-binding universal stress UspA family protein
MNQGNATKERIMFKHILVPIDGSSTSLLAIDKAAGLAKAFGSTVTALYVIDPYPFAGVGADFALGQDQYLGAAKAEASAAMEAASQRLQQAGVAAETSVAEAHTVWRGILESAERLGADLLVMGSHGRRGLEKLVLGSVTQSVLSHTRITTLVVNEGAKNASV